MDRTYLNLWKQYLTEQATPGQPEAGVQVRWKDLAKQGYEQTMGDKPLDKSATLYDANITATGRNVTQADQSLQKLLRDRKIFTWSQLGYIVHRTLDDSTIESKYLSRNPL